MHSCVGKITQLPISDWYRTPISGYVLNLVKGDFGFFQERRRREPYTDRYLWRRASLSQMAAMVPSNWMRPFSRM